MKKPIVWSVRNLPKRTDLGWNLQEELDDVTLQLNQRLRQTWRFSHQGETPSECCIDWFYSGSIYS